MPFSVGFKDITWLSEASIKKVFWALRKTIKDVRRHCVPNDILKGAI